MALLENMIAINGNQPYCVFSFSRESVVRFHSCSNRLAATRITIQFFLKGSCLCLILISSGTQAGSNSGWFFHPFGEMRAYFGDWLAVCNDNGKDDCRLVNYPTPQTRDSEQHYGRLALIIQRGLNTPVLLINLNGLDSGPLNMRVDNRYAQALFAEDAYGTSTASKTNTQNEWFLHDQTYMPLLAKAMARGNALFIDYMPQGQSATTQRVSLRGVRAGLQAIEKLYSGRLAGDKNSFFHW